MNEEEVRAFLLYPSAPLVDFALSLVNLTWQEETAIRLCGRQRRTQELAAEVWGVSTDTMQRWYRAGIRKLQIAWDGHDWIKKVIG